MEDLFRLDNTSTVTSYAHRAGEKNKVIIITIIIITVIIIINIIFIIINIILIIIITISIISIKLFETFTMTNEGLCSCFT